MGRAKCGCVEWETRNGDTEFMPCARHAGPTICPIGDREDCKHLHIESEDECWCEHPEHDGSNEDYCPIKEDEE